jgi:hypothetical protein
MLLGVTDIAVNNVAGEFERGLLGEELSGVTFVRDYLQLQFNPGPLLNALTPVTVTTAAASARFGEPLFANLLIAQINKIIRAVEFYESAELRLVFGDQSTISISLKPSDYSGPEAINLYLADGTCVVG